MANKYLPIGLAVANQKCLVVGGGKIALRKIDNLLDYDTDITVIAPETEDKIGYYAERGRIKLEKRPYQPPEAGQYNLVISASDDKAVNQQVYDDAVAAGVPVNVVDNPPLCTFIFPAVTKRNCLTVAVSTDGQAPFLAGYLRMVLDDIFPERWRRIADYAARFRDLVREEGPKGSEQKTACLQKFLAADWKTMLKKQSEEEIEAEMRSWL